VAIPVLKPENTNSEGEKELLQIGFALPFGFGYNSMTHTTIDAIKTNMKNLFVTSRGERLYQPRLGIDLKKYLFDPFSLDSEIALKEAIEAQIKIWYPFLILRSIDVVSETENHMMRFDIKFSYERAADSFESVQIELQTAGGDY